MNAHEKKKERLQNKARNSIEKRHKVCKKR